MCILFVYTNPNPAVGEYRLVIASNRDEFYKRPARNAFKCEKTGIIGGRDMEPGREGGMWLGLSIAPPTIKFATLLNVTGEDKKAATAGRGPLVYNYLATPQTALDYIQGSQTNTYSAFNLFMLELGLNVSKCYHHSNSPEGTLKLEGPQILGFGNSTPDVPFTKVKKGRQRFQDIVEDKSLDKDNLVKELLGLLKWRELHLPDPELERRAPTGVGFLSSVYVAMEEGGYGTRTHSIVLVDWEFNVEFIEHTMKEPINPAEPQWDITVIKSRL